MKGEGSRPLWSGSSNVSLLRKKKGEYEIELEGEERTWRSQKSPGGPEREKKNSVIRLKWGGFKCDPILEAKTDKRGEKTFRERNSISHHGVV